MTTEAQSDMAFALKMCGEKILAYAEFQVAADHGRLPAPTRDAMDTAYDNMVFWQNQLWMCAKAVATENKTK